MRTLSRRTWTRYLDLGSLLGREARLGPFWKYIDALLAILAYL